MRSVNRRVIIKTEKLTTRTPFVVPVALSHFGKELRRQYPQAGRATLVRTLSTAASILRGKMLQADIISPKSASQVDSASSGRAGRADGR